jgi:hypothetical protein
MLFRCKNNVYLYNWRCATFINVVKRTMTAEKILHLMDASYVIEAPSLCIQTQINVLSAYSCTFEVKFTVEDTFCSAISRVTRPRRFRIGSRLMSRMRKTEADHRRNAACHAVDSNRLAQLSA